MTKVISRELQTRWLKRDTERVPEEVAFYSEVEPSFAKKRRR
jgi:hypothetical protein